MTASEPQRSDSAVEIAHQLLDHCGDAMLACDAEFRCTAWNRSMEGLSGLDGRDVLGKALPVLFEQFATSADHALLARALGGEDVAAPERPFFLQGADRAKVLVQGRYRPLHGRQGELLGVVGVFRDVTEERLAEQLLRETDTRFRNMADAAPVLLWMAGTDGLCTFFNQTWLDFTGRTLEQEWGVGWAENIHFEDFEASINTYNESFGARRVFEMEYRLRRHDGDFRWILDRGAPRYTPQGVFAGYIGSCIDITERRKLESELRGAVQSRDEFLSVASHELGTPLTALRLQVEALLRNLRKHPQGPLDLVGLENRAVAIAEQGTRLTGLVETLLDVSRIAWGKWLFVPELVELGSLVRGVVGRLARMAEDARCPIRLQVDTMVQGLWDRTRTEQIISNLLSNALKYGAGHPVDILVDQEGDQARLVVKDHGIGIALEKQAVIFERFERVASKSHYGGLGLGLWIARRAVEEMHGTITVESRPDEGARFEVRLPATSG